MHWFAVRKTQIVNTRGEQAVIAAKDEMRKW